MRLTEKTHTAFRIGRVRLNNDEVQSGPVVEIQSNHSEERTDYTERLFEAHPQRAAVVTREVYVRAEGVPVAARYIELKYAHGAEVNTVSYTLKVFSTTYCD